MIDSTTFVFRAVPLYVQLLFTYFVIPDSFGVAVSPWLVGCMTLGCCSGAYTSEIVRSGINALPQGQWDASFVLGYTWLQQLHYIIIPQVMRIIMPVLLNECNAVLKSTAILASIGTVELTKIGMNIAIRTLDPLPVYTMIAIIYIVIVICFTQISNFIEKRYIR
jgi:ABC-type amino acid transport system permease subunit